MKVRFEFDIPFESRFASDTMRKKMLLEERFCHLRECPLIIEADPMEGVKQIGILNDPNPVIKLDEDRFVFHVTCHGDLVNSQPYEHFNQAESIEYKLEE